MEQVARWPWNAWPDESGLGGRMAWNPHIARVKFIKFSQRLGFSLDEVAQLLTLEDGTNCAEAAGIAEHKLADIRSRLQDLKQMDAVLSRLVRQCHHGDNKVCCPLIASLRQAANTARFA